MYRLFRQLPLSVKLFLVGFLPLIFLFILTLRFYHEKNRQLILLDSYIDRIHLSADLSALIDALQEERKISFDYALGKQGYSEVLKQRPITDTVFHKLQEEADPSLKGFTDYTSLYRLGEVRNQIDSGKAAANAVMHYYSNTIFRLNTLNTFSLPNNTWLDPVYQDFASQKLLTEMLTYLGIIRSNIYNVLETRKYMLETLVGITGTHDVYRSFEKEFVMKASPATLHSYKQIRNESQLRPMMDYLDTVFKNYRFDSTYSADQWWNLSDNGMEQLSLLQKTTWGKVEDQIEEIYQRERNSRNRTFILVSVALILVIALTAYMIYVITRMLGELKKAAQKIALGETNVQIPPFTHDAIGNLSSSIAAIANANHELAHAAESMGKGNFSVSVHPRNSNDVLGNAMVNMKNALMVYNEKMEHLVSTRTEALERSNDDLQQFAHVASHDLKEPMRKMRIYTSRLLEQSDNLTVQQKELLTKISDSAARMTSMIEGILLYSSVHSGAEPFQPVNLNLILQQVITDLELAVQQKKAKLVFRDLPTIDGAPVMLHQLFYNLVNNALKFSRDNVAPEIKIQHRVLTNDGISTRSKVSYEITVEDNGIGFNPEYSEKIFQSFARLHSKTEYEGTGLGLALCKKIVHYHGGKIWAESNGKGATFRFIMPGR